MTSKDTRNAISSPESEAGASPCALRDGPMTDLFGQVVAHANHSAAPAKKPRNLMSATYGRIGTGSSASQSLQQSLANRLMMELPKDGWTMFFTTWKRKFTPARRQYCQLVALNRPSLETGYYLWPTATASENDGCVVKKEQRRQKSKEKWGNMSGNGFGYSLAELAKLSMWRTPNAADHRNRGGVKSSQRRREIGKQITLSMQVKLSVSTGTNGKENSGQLNPGFVCWLMGYPSNWCEMAPMKLSRRKTKTPKPCSTDSAMQSSQTCAPSSSKPQRGA